MIPNDEQLQISDAARQFAQERLKPFAAEWDREHRFPKEARDALVADISRPFTFLRSKLEAEAKKGISA